MRRSRAGFSASTTPTGFHRQAVQFCALVAGHARLPLRVFLQRVHQSLPELYAAALALPDLCPENEPSYTPVSPKEWRRLCRAIDARLGHRTYYAEVFDAYDRQDSQTLIGNLADDLASIHDDLNNGLRCWRAGDRDNAVWYWRFMRECHWGEHATGAIRALYWLQRNTGYGPVPAMPNKRVNPPHSAVTAPAEKGRRRAGGRAGHARR